MIATSEIGGCSSASFRSMNDCFYNSARAGVDGSDMELSEVWQCDETWPSRQVADRGGDEDDKEVGVPDARHCAQWQWLMG